MASKIYKFTAGTTAGGLDFVLLNRKTGAVVPIIGAAITITAFHPKSREKLFNGSCNIDDDVNGEFSYSFIAADLTTEGTYEGEVKIVFADTTIEKIQDFYIKVEEAAPT